MNTLPTEPALLLTDVDPKMLISANRKLHYQHAGKVRAYWRNLAHGAALAAYGAADIDCTWHQRARIVIEVRWPDRRRHDVGNLYSYVAKPIVDGLIDAQVLPGDDDHHLIGPDMRRDLNRGPLQLAIYVIDLPRLTPAATSVQEALL